MGMMLLNIALFIAGALIMPPALTIALKGPVDGFNELLGVGVLTKADAESYFLAHCAYIDCGKNFFQGALCLAAIAFPPAAKKAVAVLVIAVMSWCVFVQTYAPMKASIAKYPSTDGIFANPVVLPVCGGQIVLLTLGVLLSSADPKKGKAS